MMVSDPAYRAGLDIQVNGILRLARRKSRWFGKDCLSNPGMLRQHWAKQLDIIYYLPREQDQIKTIREDGRTVDDNASFADLLGFFSPASHPEAELDKAYVAWDEGSFTTRRNFTLLHEIGHYLQETDFELMKRICSFESDYAGKRFEEDACNRFASLALLPDKFISKWLALDRSPCARDIHAVFEHGRECSAERNEVRVSRIAVVRRLGALLPSLGDASLIKNHTRGMSRQKWSAVHGTTALWISLRNSQWRRTCCTRLHRVGRKDQRMGMVSLRTLGCSSACRPPNVHYAVTWSFPTADRNSLS